MRYAINDARQQLVPLNKEITYIRNYIALQQLRFGTAIPVAFTVTGTTEGKQLPPLLLISFVENAFKHGINADEGSDIRISITVAGNELRFSCFNNKVTTGQLPDESGGIGIENTRRRLELLYSGTHTLEIKDEPAHFTVLLALQLT
jgi:LytS/YehU family sensor histidine kinase